MPRIVKNKDLIARGARLKNGGALAAPEHQEKTPDKPAMETPAESPGMVGAIDRLADAIGRLADALNAKQVG